MGTTSMKHENVFYKDYPPETWAAYIGWVVVFSTGITRIGILKGVYDRTSDDTVTFIIEGLPDAKIYRNKPFSIEGIR